MVAMPRHSVAELRQVMRRFTYWSAMHTSCWEADSSASIVGIRRRTHCTSTDTYAAESVILYVTTSTANKHHDKLEVAIDRGSKGAIAPPLFRVGEAKSNVACPPLFMPMLMQMVGADALHYIIL